MTTMIRRDEIGCSASDNLVRIVDGASFVCTEYVEVAVDEDIVVISCREACRCDAAARGARESEA